MTGPGKAATSRRAVPERDGKRGTARRRLARRCDPGAFEAALAALAGSGEGGGTREPPTFDAPAGDTVPGARRLTGDTGRDADRIGRDPPARGVPPGPARKERRPPDHEPCRPRDRAERSRAVATRRDRTAASRLAFVRLAASRLWLRHVHTV